jgi:hypothetical protein
MKTFENKLLILVLFLVCAGCTDLEIEPTDSIIENLTGEFEGVDPAASLTALNNSLRDRINTQEGIYALQEVSSDEMVVPTRGTDWGDNGVWRNLHEHTWSSTHLFVKNTWNDLNRIVFNATTIIDERSSPTPEQAAQAKFIRAFAMYQIMDLYGQVPFRTPDEGGDVDPIVYTRPEAFDFILTDLNEALPLLDASGPSAELNVPSKAAVRHLLARMYLNKHIYLGTGTPDASDMTQVITLVDAIAADGFELQAGYFDIFKQEVDSETIFFTTSDIGPRIWNSMHYNQNAPDNTGGGWNGFTTLAEFYDLFEGDPNINVPGSGQEERRGFVPTDGSHFGIGFGFLIGQQYEDNGTPLKDRQGNPLSFTRDFPRGLIVNNEVTGIRTIKYHPENGSFAGHSVVFRYSDAHLMKAEAIMRGGASSDNALALVNELRTIRGATPLAALTEQDLLDERGRELYMEFVRRPDLIRFGKFTEAWAYKDNTEGFRVLYPIPSSALITNPNLVQNEGY